MAEITSNSKLPKYLVYFFAFLGGAAVLTVIYLVLAHAIYLKKGGVVRDIEIGRFSACIKDSSSYAAMSDAEFTEKWSASSQMFEFTAEDVDEAIMECQKIGKVRINTVSGEPLLDTPERKALLEAYHQKFLNREFSVLKNQK